MITRRQLVIALGAGLLSMPLPSWAQAQVKTWRVGFLGAGERPAAGHTDANVDAFFYH